jgi:hypothetical protein
MQIYTHGTLCGTNLVVFFVFKYRMTKNINSYCILRTIMHLIKLNDFLKLFKPVGNSSSSIALKDFVKLAKVRLGKNLVPLTEYMNRKGIPMDTIQELLDNINAHDNYLTRFYNTSLLVQIDDIHMHNTGVKPMKPYELNNNTEIVYKNLIRNMHLKEILQNTSSGIENVPTYLNVLIDLYTHCIIDYKLLTPSATFYIKKGRIGSVFSSYYFRASIMNPYLVYSLNQSVLHGKRIFTPTLGWSSYCYGFLESPDVVEYVGTDVIPSVCKKTRELAKLYYDKPTVSIYCVPSEDLHKDADFMRKYKNHFDVVFFSPPYFKLEMYSGSKQSTSRYTDYQDWLSKYWEETIRLCKHVLIKGGRLCYILSGYGSQSSKVEYNLIEDMNRITRQYFKYHSIRPMYNKNVHVSTHRPTNEQIVLFTKT